MSTNSITLACHGYHAERQLATKADVQPHCCERVGNWKKDGSIIAALRSEAAQQRPDWNRLAMPLRLLSGREVTLKAGERRL